MHQRQEGRDDQRETRRTQRRKLVAETLPATCGHDQEDILAGHAGIDGRQLAFPKVGHLELGVQFRSETLGYFIKP